SKARNTSFPSAAPTKEVAEKPGKDFLQGLKPVGASSFTPGLKPRPPKEKDFFPNLRIRLARPTGSFFSSSIRIESHPERFASRSGGWSWIAGHDASFF